MGTLWKREELSKSVARIQQTNARTSNVPDGQPLLVKDKDKRTYRVAGKNQFDQIVLIAECDRQVNIATDQVSLTNNY